jgi:hypothetical protein
MASTEAENSAVQSAANSLENAKTGLAGWRIKYLTGEETVNVVVEGEGRKPKQQGKADLLADLHGPV